MQYGKPVYALYIKSAEWRKKREAKLKSVGKRCENIRCRSEFNLECHHKTYVRLGREKLRDLQILCTVCHMEDHDQRPFRAKFYQIVTTAEELLASGITPVAEADHQRNGKLNAPTGGMQHKEQASPIG